MVAAQSADKLLEFLRTVERKGWLNRASARAMLSACQQVSGSLDPNERLDVGVIDIEGAVQRFANRNPDVAPNSLRDYRSRATKSVRLYWEWRKNPTGWKPPGSSGIARRQGASRPGYVRGKPRTPKDLSPEIGGETNLGTDTLSERGLTFPFPLRPNVIISIGNIPPDLSVSECERIASFLKAVAVDRHEG